MIRYKNPRIGVFSITTDEYGPGGWVCVKEEYTIIGEHDEGYIYRFVYTSDPHSDEFGEYEPYWTFPIYIHKSRLIRWKDTQLTLF